MSTPHETNHSPLARALAGTYEPRSREGSAHSCPAPCSAFQLRLLEAMGEKWVTAGIMADRMWPDKHHPTPWSKRSAKWQKMGAMLHKLKALGFVTKHITEHGQKEWLRLKMPNSQANRPEADDHA